MKTFRISTEDLILTEAQRLAFLTIENECAISNEPLPTNIDTLIDIIIFNNPSILELAKANILAQKSAYAEALSAIGLSTIETDPLEDLEL